MLASERINKYYNYVLIATVFLAVFIWSTVSRNISADVGRNNAKIYFLDVGQGDSALILLPDNQEILIDTGKPGALLSELNAKMPAFDKKIEAVFLSHPDNDHIGSFLQLAASYKIDKLYFNDENATTKTAQGVLETAKNKGIELAEVKKGDNFYFGRLEVHALWPPENLDWLSSNDSSEVLKITYDQSDVLFVGDLEIKGQEALFRENEDLSADLLKVSHHGSAGAWDENFTKAVGAKNAVISVGANSYGHPTKTVLEGLAKFGINIYRTDEEGTIEFDATDNGWKKR